MHGANSPSAADRPFLDAHRPFGVVGGDHRREDRGRDQDGQQDEPDLRRALAEDAPRGVAPQVARARR